MTDSELHEFFEHLEKHPLGRYGLERMIEEARQATLALIRPELTQWLPDVRPHFSYLTS